MKMNLTTNQTNPSPTPTPPHLDNAGGRLGQRVGGALHSARLLPEHHTAGQALRPRLGNLKGLGGGG